VGILLVLLMFAGCLFLWVGVPIGWLWIASQVEGAASLGTALAVAMIGAISTIIVLAWGLSWLNRRHMEWRLRHGGAADGDDEDEPGGGLLEAMVVSSAALAIVLFAVWFLFFAGTSPVPLNIGY
jgi:uncharacterized membrane protein YbhN (UPF0104 family)